MSDSEALWEVLLKNRIVALLTPRDAAECISVYETLTPLNIVLEIAMRTDRALDAMTALRERHPGALFLAGTVMTANQARDAIEAGAAGIVCPDYFPAVVDRCVQDDVMCIPGGLADVGKQLAQKAEGYGCAIEHLREQRPYQWVHKLFPAIAGRTMYYEAGAAWKAVYKDLRILYTGGVTAHTVGMIAAKDEDAIVCGSALTRPAPDAEALHAEAERWIAAVRRPKRSGVAAPAAVGTVRRGAPGKTVVTFGELMLRLSPAHGFRFEQTECFHASFGGSEANVAVALARWGLSSRFVTALPTHAIGQSAVGALRAQGVDTSCILRQGNRIGVYFLEHGAAQRPSRVIYDRERSAASGIERGEVNWDVVLEDAGWLHCSGITPALSPEAARVTSEALRTAKERGLTVSFDLNYRAKLWTRDEARATLTPLMGDVDIVIANEEDADAVFGIRAEGFDAAAGRLRADAYGEVARRLVEQFGLRLAAVTLRESRSASVNVWSACAHDGTRSYHTEPYEIQLVDRVGAGDAFAAGFIYGLLTGDDTADALQFAVGASCLKQTIHGDFSLVTVDEITQLLSGDVSGRVKR